MQIPAHLSRPTSTHHYAVKKLIKREKQAFLTEMLLLLYFFFSFLVPIMKQGGLPRYYPAALQHSIDTQKYCTRRLEKKCSYLQYKFKNSKRAFAPLCKVC